MEKVKAAIIGSGNIGMTEDLALDMARAVERNG